MKELDDDTKKYIGERHTNDGHALRRDEILSKRLRNRDRWNEVFELCSQPAEQTNGYPVKL